MDIRQAASAYGSVANLTQNNAAANVAGSKPAAGPTFADMINNALGDSVEKGRKAEDISTLALMGKADITDLATSVNSAELALSTVVAIRDKVISAYQQIMQMSI